MKSTASKSDVSQPTRELEDEEEHFFDNEHLDPLAASDIEIWKSR